MDANSPACDAEETYNINIFRTELASDGAEQHDPAATVQAEPPATVQAVEAEPAEEETAYDAAEQSDQPSAIGADAPAGEDEDDTYNINIFRVKSSNNQVLPKHK